MTAGGLGTALGRRAWRMEGVYRARLSPDVGQGLMRANSGGPWPSEHVHMRLIRI